MNSLGGLSAFFYNVIPGVIFLLVLDNLNVVWFKLKDLPGDDPEKIFWIITIGLFLGFFGQATIKFLKDIVINKLVFNFIKKNNDTEYEDAIEKLSTIGIKKSKYDQNKKVFYAMDNNLRYSGPYYIINHYSERAAFWANIFLGLIVISSILLYERRAMEMPIYILLLIITLIFWLSSVRSQYESVLQTFLHKKTD